MTEYFTRSNTNYRVSGTDLVEEGFVTKEYMIDAYPILAAELKKAGLWLWGQNNFGMIGDNTRTHRSSPVQTIAGGQNWIQVSTGGFDGPIGLKADGTIWTWGRNNSGQLGDNTIVHRSSPVQVVGNATNWSKIDSSWDHKVAIKTDGTLWVWGDNWGGQLGIASLADRSSPVQTVAGGSNWTQVSAGGGTTGALKSDNTFWVWGYNEYGALGNNSSIHRSSPVQVSYGGASWKQISMGLTSSAGIKTDGTLWTWGANRYFSDATTIGQLGDNTTVLQRSSPVQTVAGGSNWKVVSAGGYTTGAIKTDGTLWTWGNNDYGQLGDNTRTHRSSPVQTIAGGTNWKEINVGGFNVAAIKTDGTLWCWGDNSVGGIGDGSPVHRSSPVQTISGGTNWKTLTKFIYTTGAIRDDSEDPF